MLQYHFPVVFVFYFIQKSITTDVLTIHRPTLPQIHSMKENDNLNKTSGWNQTLFGCLMYFKYSSVINQSEGILGRPATPTRTQNGKKKSCPGTIS